MRLQCAIAALLLPIAACDRNAPAPAGGPEAPGRIPPGYEAFAWGTARERIAGAHGDARPGRDDPDVLVRDVRPGEGGLRDATATEVYFFDAEGRLEEVEVRWQPKRTPEESAAIARALDARFGPHLVAAADEHLYQFAWIGDDTEVRLTYDLRESVPFGPVMTWAARGGEPEAAATALPAATEEGDAPQLPGAGFAGHVRRARAAGLRLAAVEASRGKLLLVFSGPDSAVEVALASDPSDGRLLGSSALPRARLAVPPMARAEAALDRELARGAPVGMTFDHPAKGFVTLRFPAGRWVAFDPSAGDPLAGTSESVP